MGHGDCNTGATVADSFESLIPQCDTDETLYFLDPPYVPETRGNKDIYAHEMAVESHEKLLELIRNVKGKVILSGYRSDLYDEALQDWHVEEKSCSTTLGTGKGKKTVEVLWMNFQPIRVGEAVKSFAFVGLKNQKGGVR